MDMKIYLNKHNCLLEVERIKPQPHGQQATLNPLRQWQWKVVKLQKAKISAKYRFYFEAKGRKYTFFLFGPIFIFVT